MSEVLYYIAMALFVISAIAYSAYLYNSIKNKLRLDFNTLIKKNTLVLGGFSLGIVLSLIFPFWLYLHLKLVLDILLYSSLL